MALKQWTKENLKEIVTTSLTDKGFYNGEEDYTKVIEDDLGMDSLDLIEGVILPVEEQTGQTIPDDETEGALKLTVEELVDKLTGLHT